MKGLLTRSGAFAHKFPVLSIRRLHLAVGAVLRLRVAPGRIVREGVAINPPVTCAKRFVVPPERDGDLPSILFEHIGALGLRVCAP